MCSIRESLHVAVWPFAAVLLLLGFLGTPSFAQGTDSDHGEQAGGELQGRFDLRVESQRRRFFQAGCRWLRWHGRIVACSRCRSIRLKRHRPFLEVWICVCVGKQDRRRGQDGLLRCFKASGQLDTETVAAGNRTIDVLGAIGTHLVLCATAAGLAAAGAGVSVPRAICGRLAEGLPAGNF